MELENTIRNLIGQWYNATLDQEGERRIIRWFRDTHVDKIPADLLLHRDIFLALGCMPDVSAADAAQAVDAAIQSVRAAQKPRFTFLRRPWFYASAAAVAVVLAVAGISFFRPEGQNQTSDSMIAATEQHDDTMQSAQLSLPETLTLPETKHENSIAMVASAPSHTLAVASGQKADGYMELSPENAAEAVTHSINKLNLSIERTGNRGLRDVSRQLRSVNIELRTGVRTATVQLSSSIDNANNCL